MQRKERNNKGFTLVELLVAVTILAIIVVPFMQSFVTAAKTNAKAKKIQNATELASNVMEELKSNDIEHFAFQFNYPTDGDNKSRFNVLNTFDDAYELIKDSEDNFTEVIKYQVNGAVNNLDLVTSSVVYKDYQENKSDEFEFKGQDSDNYYFVMEGVKSGDGEFDALITLNANSYQNIYETGYNDQEIPVISTPDVLSDAFYVQGGNVDLEYAQKIMDQAKALNSNIEKVEHLMDGTLANGEISRQITIDMNKSGNLIQVYATYKYTYKDQAGTIVEPQGFTVLLYDNAENQTKELESVYMCYKPLYTSTGYDTTNMRDSIIINNTDSLEVDFYLIKQRESTNNISYMKTKESAYRCEIIVTEANGVNPSALERSNMTLRTNIGYNMYDTANKKEPDQYRLYYDSSYNPISGGTPSKNYSVNNAAALGLTTLDGGTRKDRIYEVTVSIYDKGQADEGFSKDPVVQITGSKDN